MVPRASLVPVLILVALGAAQPAAAATLTLSRTCLSSQSPMTISGAGFAPGKDLTVNQDGVGQTKVVSGPDGSFTAPLTAPVSNSSVGQAPRKVVYSVTDGTTVAMLPADVIRPGAVAPTAGRTRNRMTFGMAGFEPGRLVYAHLRWGSRWRRQITLGTAQGPCGALTTTRKLLRKLGTRGGREIYVQFDQNQTPSTTSHQTVVLRYRVWRGSRGNPENYRLFYNGWREKTTP